MNTESASTNVNTGRIQNKVKKHTCARNIGRFPTMWSPIPRSPNATSHCSLLSSR